jgi:hypothetical protein
MQNAITAAFPRWRLKSTNLKNLANLVRIQEDELISNYTNNEIEQYRAKIG